MKATKNIFGSELNSKTIRFVDTDGVTIATKLDPVTSEIIDNLIEDNERLSNENEFLKNRKEMAEFSEANLRGLVDQLVKENKDLMTENNNLRKIIKALKDEMQEVKIDLRLTKKERDELSRSWANSVKMCSYYRDLYFTAAEEEEDND